MTFRFDRFTLDGDTRRLLLGRDEVHLSPKALRLLLVLIENRHRAVSRAELQKELWPSTFVLDTNLASLIKEIRRGLGDNVETPRFVRTVHRFGYWFIAEVRDTSPPQSGDIRIRYWLIWASRQIPVTEGEHVLGRAPDASVWIDVPGISRHHARLVLQGQHATVEDLGARTGRTLAKSGSRPRVDWMTAIRFVLAQSSSHSAFLHRWVRRTRFLPPEGGSHKARPEVEPQGQVTAASALLISMRRRIRQAP